MKGRFDVPALDFSGAGPSYSEQAREYFRFYSLDISGARHVFGSFDSGGEKICAHFFIPDNYTAAVVIVHGYLEHSGLSRNLIASLVGMKFAVAVYDNTGHGLSGGESAGVSGFGRYTEVLKDMLAVVQKNLQGPYHLVSHSMGGAVVIDFLLQGREKDILDRILLIAPLVRPVGWVKTNILYFILRHLVKSVRRNLADGTSDKDFVRFFKSDPLVPPRISVSWVKALLEWNRNMPAKAPCDRKIKVLQGTRDSIVDWKYNVGFIRAKFTSAEIELMSDADHNLCNELEPFKTKALDSIKKYLVSR